MQRAELLMYPPLANLNAHLNATCRPYIRATRSPCSRRVSNTDDPEHRPRTWRTPDRGPAAAGQPIGHIHSTANCCACHLPAPRPRAPAPRSAAARARANRGSKSARVCLAALSVLEASPRGAGWRPCSRTGIRRNPPIPAAKVAPGSAEGDRPAVAGVRCCVCSSRRVAVAPAGRPAAPRNSRLPWGCWPAPRRYRYSWGPTPTG